MWCKRLLVSSERTFYHDQIFLKVDHFNRKSSVPIRCFRPDNSYLCSVKKVKNSTMSEADKGKEIYKRLMDIKRHNANSLIKVTTSHVKQNNIKLKVESLEETLKEAASSKYCTNCSKKLNKKALSRSSSYGDISSKKLKTLGVNFTVTFKNTFCSSKLQCQTGSAHFATYNDSLKSNNQLVNVLGNVKLSQENVQNNSNKPENVQNNSNKPENVEDSSKPEMSEATKSLFSKVPKNILHNYYSIVSNELGDKTLTVAPQYKKVKGLKKGSSLWNCSYNIKWPTTMSFSHTAMAKQEASTKAAHAALMWLLSNKKINDRGYPITYEKEEVKSTTKNIPLLTLDKHTESKFEEMKNLFDEKMKPYVENYEINSDSYGDFENINKEWPEYRQSTISAYSDLNSFIIRDRVKLPISEFRQEILENLKSNRALILKGEPGCGKSTRVPQYILEQWASNGDHFEPCRIVVTQPRRIAAVSLADRVASERNEQVGKVIGYQVRFDSKFNYTTGRVMYCTSGILLRHLQSDPKLSDCTHIILDEAHERDVNVDLLMNLLKKALILNENLKVIVMSASIDTKLFQKYFDNAPVLSIPGFTYPVKEYFIEENSPHFSKTLKSCTSESPSVVCEEVAELIERINEKKPEGAILCFLPGWEEISKIRRLLENNTTMSVLCLHSRMNILDQKKVFSHPPPGIRKVILSTNIAETSVTVNDVVYVIDTGIHKEQFYDSDKGMYCLGNHWISQSSMKQRKGRAGRVQPGESYHLYPYSFYEKFQKFSVPEILRTCLTKIVLDSKVVSSNMNAVEFLSQLPTPPDLNATKRAVNELKELELLDENENLTPLGRVLSEFQLDPKLSKAMVNALIYKCVTPIVDIVTIFSAESELFSKGLTDKNTVKRTKEKYSQHSDHLALMRLFETWLGHYEQGHFRESKRFAESRNLIDSKFQTIDKLRKVHFQYLQKGVHRVFPICDDFSDNDGLVLGVLLSGVGTILQHRNWDIVKGRLKKAKCFLTAENSQRATITSESVNFKKSHLPSDYFLYLNETLSNVRRTVLIRETSIISPLTVLLFRNKPVLIEDLPKQNGEETVDLDQVLVKLSDTKIKFICSRRQATLIKDCKEALHSVMKYYIYQMTCGGKRDFEVDKNWEELLRSFNDVLIKQSYD